MKSRHLAHSSKLVVVIEDDSLVLEATESLFRSWGYSVIAAETYPEALTQLARLGGRPDLIVCDYRLSHGTNGVDAVECLRQAFEIPALLISAHVPDAAGVIPDGFRLLHKPLNAEALRNAVLDAGVPPQ